MHTFWGAVLFLVIYLGCFGLVVAFIWSSSPRRGRKPPQSSTPSAARTPAEGAEHRVWIEQIRAIHIADEAAAAADRRKRERS